MIFPVNDFKGIALDSSLASFHLKVENNVYIRAFSMLNKELDKEEIILTKTLSLDALFSGSSWHIF